MLPLLVASEQRYQVIFLVHQCEAQRRLPREFCFEIPDLHNEAFRLLVVLKLQRCC